MSPGIPATFFERIAEILDADLELVTTSSGPVNGDNPFRDGTADLGWMCSTSFVELSAPDSDPSVDLVGVAWVPDDPGSQGEAVYFGDVIVPAESAVQSLDDLAGTRIGCNDPVSLSGFYALKIALEQRGIAAENWAELVFTGGHNASMDQLVAGELDAAVVDSVARTRRSRTDAAVAKLRVVDRLGPWPTQPLVARKDLDVDTRVRVRNAILAASQEAALRSELDDAAMAELVTVDDAHYEHIRDAMQPFLA